MTRRHVVPLVLLLFCCVGAGAFGLARATGRDPAPAARTGAASADAQDGRAASAAPDATPDRGRVAHPPETTALATVRGSLAGTRLGLLSLRRAGGRVLVASVRLTIAADADADGLNTLWGDLSRQITAGNVSAMELRDGGTGRATVPQAQGYTRCDCSTLDEPRAGESIDLGATFRMPTAKGPFTLRVPGFPAIAGIEPGTG